MFEIKVFKSQIVFIIFIYLQTFVCIYQYELCLPAKIIPLFIWKPILN